MTEDRKNELSHMCAVQIRQANVIAKSLMSDYGYHFVQSVFDAEFQAMLDRLEDKPFTEHDVPVLMDLLMDDLWPRLRDQHRQHRDYVFDAVKKMNRETITEDASFAFDIGWRMLLQSAADRVETYPSEWKARLVGGKEKFGCCVLHIACDYDQPGCRSEIERLREEVRLRSLATCDICGENGRLRLGGYAKTVCEKHAAIFEGFREDDGLWADPWRWHDEKPLKDHIADVIATGRAVMAAAEETALGKRIDEDTWSRSGREQELLIEFGGRIEEVVVGSVDKAEYLDDYIAKELDGWRTTAVVPVPDRDREFLHGYLRELIDTEYERVKAKAAERNKD